ncbi:hypothetical protein F2Q69_00061401 [Brassica cretica]|uniref:Uncharacterized protein n=1 Tax=Brassica cretica TaxID=69181 RepID=A0A8S9RFL1_BRACR|nr:hypothetical protein F2Q69_00061401 [Brassica cretica]
MPNSTRSNKETQLIFSPDPASLERSIHKEARSLSTDNNTPVSLDSAQPLSTKTPVPSTDTRSPLSTDDTHLPSTNIFHPTSIDIPSRTSIDTEPRDMVAPLILVRDNKETCMTRRVICVMHHPIDARHQQSIDTRHQQSIDTHPQQSIDTKNTTSIGNRPIPKTTVSEKDKLDNQYLTPDEFGIFRDPDGNPEQKATKESYDTAGGIDNGFIHRSRHTTHPSIDVDVSTSVARQPEFGKRAYDLYGNRKFYWEEKYEYGVYRDDRDSERDRRRSTSIDRQTTTPIDRRQTITIDRQTPLHIDRQPLDNIDRQPLDNIDR